MFTRTRCIFALGLLAPAMAITLVGSAESPAPAPALQPVAAVQTAEGIPITSTAVREACGSCHVSDAEGRMSRISYRRATPENWELTLKRMLALNNAPITAEQARVVLKYLSDNLGLAPEEAAPVEFIAERRMDDFTYEGDTQTHNLCNQCHTIGRVLSERRTPEEWKLLVAMHRGVYPGIDGGSGGFRRGAGGGRNGGGGANAKVPMDLAIEHLQKALPLMSPEWSAWTAARGPMRLVGRWAVSGHQAGIGPVYGEVVVQAQPDTPEGFTTKTTLTYAASGKTVTLEGRGLVYTGFQWRGRSMDGASTPETWREAAVVSRDQNTITGRWFTGDYAETGIDVTLRRITLDPMVSGLNVASLQTGATGQTLKIYGANLPAGMTPGDVMLGAGVTVSSVVSATPTMATVMVDVAADARVGPRDISIAGAARPAAFVVYDKVDGVNVTPMTGLARVGGIVFPKQFQQFEAIAFASGADGEAGTEDDLLLGPVAATWSMEEYSATFLEDDLKYVGELSSTGLFTPNVDGINPDRGGRNNIGDVWIVAEYAPAGGTPVKGRAHLLVAPPLYMDWSSTEVGK